MKLDGMLFNKYEDRDVSVYARTETIDEFVEEFDIEFEHISQEEYYDMLDEEEYLILSRYFDYNDGEHWVLDPLIERFGQVYNECDVMLVEKGVAKAIDFKKVDYNEIDLFDGVVTYVEDEMEDVDSRVETAFDVDRLNEEMLQEMADDLLDELIDLSEADCPCCTIKKYIRLAYEIGKDDAVNDTMDDIDEDDSWRILGEVICGLK